MSKFKAIILGCFCLAFLAGVSTGLLWCHRPKDPPRHSWIGRELDLTPEQREQMREIWSNAMSASPQQQRDQRRVIREERDEAIRGIFSEEQTKQYEEVIKRYEERSAALDAERKAAFERAVEQTKAILTEEQRAKYEELQKRRPPSGGRHRRGPGEGERGQGPGNPPPPPGPE